MYIKLNKLLELVKWQENTLKTLKNEFIAPCYVM
jgi:hypothetical protein